MPGRVFKIGSRPSKLALWQARWVADRIGAPAEVVPVRTSGDRHRDRRFEEFGIQGIFTKELELALVDRRVDIAVHSLKDVPTALPPGLSLAAVTSRGPVGDALLVHPDSASPGVPFPVRRPGKVGTSSQRRSALLHAFGQGLAAHPLRGNVDTRIQACRQGRYDAVLLALAGLARLEPDTSPLLVYELDPETWLPAPGQAALALETRADDDESRGAAARIGSDQARMCTSVERAMLAHFATGCHAPFAAWATIKENELTLRLGLGSSQPAMLDSNPWKVARVTASLDTLNEIDAARLSPAELGPILLSESEPRWSIAATMCGTPLCRRLDGPGQ